MRHLLLLVILSGCAARAPAPVPPTGALPAELLPSVFAPEQLRENLPVGMVLVFRHVEGAASKVETWTVTAADAQGCTLTFAVDGEVEEGTFTWAELSAHASFPVAGTTRTEGSVTVPAGTFAVWTYTVVGRDGTDVFHFDPAHPGPPIRMATIVDGAEVRVMELVSRGSP